MTEESYIVWGREPFLYGADNREEAYAHAERTKAIVFRAHLDPGFKRQWRVNQLPPGQRRSE